MAQKSFRLSLFMLPIWLVASPLPAQPADRATPAPPATAISRQLSSEESAILGIWKHPGGYSQIDTTFEFKPDGTYFYDAGRGSAWRVSHEGTFSVRASRLRATDRILVLTPTRILKEPGREGQLALEQDRRMDNTPRQFKISDSPRGAFKVPTKTLQDLDRDPTGAMQWWISRDVRP